MNVVRIAVALAPNSKGKIARSLRARRNLVSSVQTQAARMRDRSRPLVWFHAPSVGEGLQAKPIIEAFRIAHPDVQIAYTFFSPSAEKFAASIPADFVSYLPFDSVRNCDAMLDALSPSVVVFVKLDVWPTLVERAKARRIKIALLSATMSAVSGRQGPLARTLLNDAYAALDAIGAIDQNDINRLIQIGARNAVCSITGDSRFDQVLERAESSRQKSAMLSNYHSTRVTLVAGSTWPADERVLFSAWKIVLAKLPGARLIIAPHEPTNEHLANIREHAQQLQLRARTTTELEVPGMSDAARDAIDVLIVDRMGILGDLYAVAATAFVGGGFHSAGLHSAVEPAAFGIPVVFGPQHQSSREAALLLAAGGAQSVTEPQNLATQLLKWLGNERERSRDGAEARAVVLKGLGAATKSSAIISSLLDDSMPTSA